MWLMAVAMAAFLAAWLIWSFSGLAHTQGQLSGVLFAPPAAAIALTSFVFAANRCRAHPRIRRAWLLMAIGGSCYVAGDIVQNLYDASGPLPFPSVADVFYLSFYPLTLAACLLAAAPAASRYERIRRGLDIAVVGVSATILMVSIILNDAINRGGTDVFKTAVSVAYPAGDLILLVGVGAVVLHPTVGASRRPFVLLAVALAVFVVADVAYNDMQMRSIYHEGDWVDGVYLLAIALFAVASAAQPRLSRHDEPEPATATIGVSWLPYTAAALGYVLLLISQRHEPLLPGGAIVLGVILIGALVSARQYLAQQDLVRARAELSHQSLHDDLTGLPNRTLVFDRATQMLARARRTQKPVAALFVDIDGFKEVNDDHGHWTGDQLLRAVARRLSAVIRDSDTAGRFGGDEFIVLLEDPTAYPPAELVAERVCDVLRRPVDLGDGRQLSITASVGIAYGTTCTPDELLNASDLAMYTAKAMGKDRWSLDDTAP